MRAQAKDILRGVFRCGPRGAGSVPKKGVLGAGTTRKMGVLGAGTTKKREKLKLVL